MKCVMMGLVVSFILNVPQIKLNMTYLDKLSIKLLNNIVTYKKVHRRKI